MKKVLLCLCTLLVSQVIAQPSWTQKTDFPGCRYDGVAFAIDDKVYYGLGIGCSSPEDQNFYVFNTVANTWSPIATFPGSTRRKASAFSINGKGYVCLGYSGGAPLNDLWEYDPAMNTWTARASFPGVGRGAAVADVTGNKAYVGTGFSPTMGYPMDFWSYDPVMDTWTAKTSFPSSEIALYEAKSFAMGDTVYVIGGVGGALLLEHNKIWAYSVSANTWTQKPDFPGGTARWYATAFALGGKGYCGYGMVGTSYISDFHAYDPATGNWSSVVSNGMGGMLFNGGGGGVATATAGYCLAGVTSSAPSPPTTDTWEFKSGIVTAVPTHVDLSTDLITVFPNPAMDQVSIQAAQPGTYTVYNYAGETVYSFELKQAGTHTLSTHTLAAGVYVISSVDHARINQKMVVNK